MNGEATYKPFGDGLAGVGMNVIRFGFRSLAVAAALVCSAGSAMAQTAPRAVVELFTSQGCSSCPPADQLLGELANDKSLVAMTLPIDYWDYLGWKDTLALHGHSARQRAYSIARGDREVYTPQVVVNGVVHVLGSDKAAIEAAIAQSRRDTAALALPVRVAVAAGVVTVTLPDSDAANSGGEVWLCPVSGKVSVKIGRGENRGNTVTYTNVVRRWVKLGDWNGKAQTFTYKVDDLTDATFMLTDIDRVDVVVQQGEAAKPGLMLGAATASLR